MKWPFSQRKVMCCDQKIIFPFTDAARHSQESVMRQYQSDPLDSIFLSPCIFTILTLKDMYGVLRTLQSEEIIHLCVSLAIIFAIYDGDVCGLV